MKKKKGREINEVDRVWSQKLVYSIIFLKNLIYIVLLKLEFKSNIYITIFLSNFISKIFRLNVSGVYELHPAMDI